MRVTIVGSGDAFGTGGRTHTCFKIDALGKTVVVDFGAASIVGWKKLGHDCAEVDAVVISHLHGDHFGGLPFLLLDCQFVARRTKPLTMIGPPGLGKRIDDALETFFSVTKAMRWNFPWQVEELPARGKTKAAGLALESFEVVHGCCGVATGVRLDDGKNVFAYSGDTAWTEALFEISKGADIFVVECYSGENPVPHHIHWPALKANLAGFSAKRIVVTHMSESALARRPEMEMAGLTLAYDGQTFDL